MGFQKDRVKFNVGGKIFETTATTLAIAGRDSLFGAILDDNWNVGAENSGEYFIDRNPYCFAVLLDLLRTGELDIPPNLPEKLIYREALFYGLLDHVRSSKWGPLDGNRLRLFRSITGQAPGDGTAIRAGPNGGCCVAHNSMVHVYDWTMEEHPPINLDYQRINDACWIDPNNIVISACERIGRTEGGMGLFSASTGELLHRFNVRHENQAKSYTAGALFSGPNNKLFSSCKGRSYEYGIGVWDQITGKQIDFYYEPSNWPLGEADKIQWQHSTNCLMVATLFPRKDNCYISLLDFREKKMVWSWCDVGDPSMEERRARDAVAMDGGSRGVCVVNEYEDLGFLDMRNPRGGGGIRWSSRSRLMKGKISDEICYPRLVFHEGRLYSSMNDCVSMFSGPDWVLTSRIRQSYGGSICDFSIGGDRLFALHSEENVFDVWETPSTPNII